MTFEPKRDPDPETIRAMLEASTCGAVRRIWDAERACYCYWKAEQATHAWGAEYLGVAHEPFGGGEVLVLED